MSFIQSDGFNPLTVNGDSFQIIVSSKDILNKSSNIYQLASNIQSLSINNNNNNNDKSNNRVNQIISLLTVPWRPGQLFESFKKIGIQFDPSIRSTILTMAIKLSTPVSITIFFLITNSL